MSPSVVVFDDPATRRALTYDGLTLALAGKNVALQVPVTVEDRDAMLADAVVVVSDAVTPISGERLARMPSCRGIVLHRRDDEARTVADIVRLLDGVDTAEAATGDVDVSRIAEVEEFMAIAEARLSKATFGYVTGGAGRESTVRRNRECLDDTILFPRVLRNMNDADPSTSVLGERLEFPLLIAPSAVQRLATPDGELATARAARDAGIMMILSMNSSTSVEDVAATGVRFWMQLYFSRNRDHMRGIVERAEAAGAKALCVTVDHAGMPVRPREMRDPLVIPPHVTFAHLGETDATRKPDFSLSWETIEWLRSVSSLPIVLKGLVHPSDAAMAVDIGIEALVLSNHGGRQLDGTVSGYDVIDDVSEVVAGRSELLVDGGIRSGTDLLKAVAMGARAGLIGRPAWWALAAAGEAGVGRVLELIRNDFLQTMTFCGSVDVDAVTPELIWRGNR